MEDDKYTGRKYGRAFGSVPEGDAGDENNQDVEQYLRDLKQSQVHRTAKKSTPFGVEKKDDAVETDTEVHRLAKKKASFGIGRGTDTASVRGSRWLSERFGKSFGRKRKLDIAPEASDISDNAANILEEESDISEESEAYKKKKDGRGSGEAEGRSDRNSDRYTDRSNSDNRSEKSSRLAVCRTTDDQKTGSINTATLTGRSDDRKDQKSQVGSGSSEVSDGKGSSSPAENTGNTFSGTGLDSIRNTFRAKQSGADKERNARQTAAANDNKGGAYQGVFNIAGEEVEGVGTFVKGKTKFARSIGETDKEGSELATDAMKESSRTVIQLITHLVTQVKNVITLIVTMTLGPVAGAIVAIIGQLISLFVTMITIVVVVVIGVIVVVATLVTTFVSFFIGLFVDEFNNTAEMYRYAYSYAVEYEAALEEEAAGYEFVVIYRNDVMTTWTSFTIDYEAAYLVYIGENQEAEYKNSDLELAEGSVAGNLPYLMTENEENEEAFKTAFAGLYYTEVSEDGSTLMIHTNSPSYYTMISTQENQNVYYLVQALTKNEDLRDTLDMLDESLAILYPKED